MPNAFLDILIVGLLVLVFGSIHRTRATVRLRYWIIGWFLILVHFAVLLANPSKDFWLAAVNSLVLSTLVLGGAAFLLAGDRPQLGVMRGLRLIALLCGPAVLYITLACFQYDNHLLLTGVVLLQSGGTLVVIQRLWQRHASMVRLGMILVPLCAVWSLVTVYNGNPVEGAYAELTLIYLLNAMLYWLDFRRASMGVVTAISGMVAWAAVFPCAVALAAWLPHVVVSSEVWNLPKYFVEFGMILTLLEDEIIAMAHQREEYRLLFEYNPHPMWIYDEESFGFLKVNEAAAAAYGYSMKEFSRMSLHDLRPIEEKLKLEYRLRELEELSRQSGPWTHIRSDGSRIKVDIASHAIQFEGQRARFALVQDVTERIELHQKLVHQANHDILTGLPNRLLLKDRMEQTLNAAARSGDKVAVMCMDLDRFKQINDRYGHHIGDACLKHLADLLRSRLRAADTVARSGGEEFTVLLAGLSSSDDAARVAQLLLEGIRQPFVVEGYNLEISASLGIAMYPDDSKESQELWRASDTAMYRAKNSGGNQFVFVSNELSAAALESNEIESALRQALKEGGDSSFQVLYQPQYSATGELRGMEALLRLKHPQQGIITPERFIPVAEESGLIVRMGVWVLEDVCRQIAEWRRQGLPITRIALNVSPLQIVRADFADVVKAILKKHAVEPSLLEIEITETTVMRNLDDAARQMLELSAIGVQFSVDDFGTGYSSLRHLHQLPISTLKIDRSFIDRICDESEAREIVHAILSLAHSLGMQVVAEGVERKEQLELLRSMECDQLQGFLWGRPREAAFVPELLTCGTMDCAGDTPWLSTSPRL
ncbi:putative bifunctional diguanylate cyclase/phosphodiesterase [Silvibacterium sp.]|uniref:putative bifunctional diguanylate cyclase/phosphodiesterase n=1 Tax=Silvibacterium sp. TaxID=1964179 RepID=UPI0039E23DBF